MTSRNIYSIPSFLKNKYTAYAALNLVTFEPCFDQEPFVTANPYIANIIFYKKVLFHFS